MGGEFRGKANIKCLNKMLVHHVPPITALSYLKIDSTSLFLQKGWYGILPSCCVTLMVVIEY